ncbi:MAG: hypothetical protein HYX92_07765 [Chloroflexi bacterium]|nr:hypothetical protein [Chloroflexota bacterium]
MDRSRLGGIIVCVITVVAAILFIWGIIVDNRWAVAIPVAIGFLGVLSLGFWIGWTMIITEVDDGAAKPQASPSTEPTEKG